MQAISRQFIFAATTAISVIFGILLEALSGDLFSTWSDDVKISSLMGLGLLFCIFLWLRSRFSGTHAIMRQAIVLNEERQDAAQPHIKRGLVLMVSLYSPQKSTIGAALKQAKGAQKQALLDQIETAKQALDFETLDLPNSNLVLGIQAVKAHASKLEACWLLSTEDLYDAEHNLVAPGSYSSARVLAAYLSQDPALKNVDFYYEDFSIRQGAEARIAGRIQTAMNRAFLAANARKIAASDIAADITSGTGAMKLGMILTSLDSDRDIQFMGTTYADDATPVKGQLNPILYPFTTSKTD